MKTTREHETVSQTPEQLLELLEHQLDHQRQHRARSDRYRALFLVGGVLFIVVGAGAALLVLQQMLADLQTSSRAARLPRPPAEHVPAQR